MASSFQFTSDAVNVGTNDFNSTTLIGLVTEAFPSVQSTHVTELFGFISTTTLALPPVPPQQLPPPSPPGSGESLRLPPLEDVDLTHLANIIQFGWIIGICFFVLSLIGNSISFIVFSQKQFKGSSYSMLSRLLAIVDTLVNLLPGCIISLPKAFGYHDLLSTSNIYCVIGSMTFPLQGISAWILVILSIERLVAVLSPFKAKQIMNKKVVFGMMSAVMTTIFATYIPMIITANAVIPPPFMVELGMTAICGPDHSLPMYDAIFPILNISIQTVIPSGIIFLSNAVLIRAVIMANRARKQTTNAHSKSTDVNNMAAMLVGLNVTYMILSLPSCVSFFLIQHKPTRPSQSAINDATFAEIANLVKGMNHAIYIFLYCLFGRSFRQELASLLCCRRRSVSSRSHSFKQQSTRSSRLTGTSHSDVAQCQL